MMRIIIAVLFFLSVTNAFAAEVSWMYVQNRRYENGRNVNRLAFGLVDENGHHLSGIRSIRDVELVDPNGKRVQLSNLKFDSDIEIYGLYDGLKSQWYYTDHWQTDSWFRANFKEPLIPGEYLLEVKTIDGKAGKRNFKFNKTISLPIVSSNSFKFYSDESGNVIWKWDIPDSLGQLIYNHQTGVKATIDIYQDDRNIAYFFVKIPSHMGYVFIPRHIIQAINGKGNKFGLKVQLETRDNNARTYSNTVVIYDMMSEIARSE